jgi:hypothetical protein
MSDPRKHDEPLAAWTDHALKQLPARPAPATLAPRILAALARRRALPWYRTPWFNWPRHFQVLSAVLAAAVVGVGLWLILPHTDAVTLASAKQAAGNLEIVRPVSVTASILGTLGNAFLLVVKSLNTWVLAGLLGAFALVWSTTLGLGTACWRMASGAR